MVVNLPSSATNENKPCSMNKYICCDTCQDFQLLDGHEAFSQPDIEIMWPAAAAAEDAWKLESFEVSVLRVGRHIW